MRKLLALSLICVIGVSILIGVVYFIIQHREKSKIEVFLTSFPPKAVVYIDKKRYPELTPTTIRELTEGWHEFKVCKKGYLPWSSTLELSPGMKKEIPIKLVPIPLPEPVKPTTPTVRVIKLPLIKFADLRIDTDPLGADIFINGKPKGKTPQRIKLQAERTYSVVLKKDLYSIYEKRIYLPKAGYALRANLSLKLGKIRVLTEPEGASLFLKGKYMGKTPLTLTVPPWNPQKIELKKEGYIPLVEDIFTNPGEEVTLDINLKEEKKGYLYITSLPSGAEIYVQDRYLGVTPLRKIPYPVGKYTFYARMKGYKEETKLKLVEEEKPTFLHFSLLPKGTPTQ
jgi:hypothetical protein